MKNIKFEQVFKGNTNTLRGDKFHYPNTERPEIERWIVTLPPESVGEWHYHLVPEFFYVEQGTLYVVNELEDKSLKFTTYGKGDHGLTDCHVPQFIWNPDKHNSVIVTAIYIGCSKIKPTKALGKKPNRELLDNLLEKISTQDNLTEINNQANKNDL